MKMNVAILATVVALAGCAPDEERATVDLVPFDDLFVLVDSVHLETGAADPLGSAADIVLWNGLFAVSDRLGDNVKLFSSEGDLEMTLGQVGDGPGEFRYPTSLAVDAHDRLVVLDEGHGRVSFFTQEGDLGESFQFVGSFTGFMDVVDEGTQVLIGTGLRQEGQERSVNAAHVYSVGGDLQYSFATWPEAEVRAETPFMGIRMGVIDDSVAVWGTYGRPNLYMSSFEASSSSANVDTIQVAGVSAPVWQEAPADDRELFGWSRDYELLAGILSGPGAVVAQFMGGDIRKDEEWYRYAVVPIAAKRTVALTEATRFQVQSIDGESALGVTIEADGEAYLRTYRLSDILSQHSTM